MKIRIITNSNETLKAVNAISNLDLSHGFSFGPDKNWELLSENSWFTNVFKILDSKVSQYFPLREKEKLVATEIASSAKKLNEFLSIHNNDSDSIDYLKNSSLFIHSDSSFNKFIRNISLKYAKYADMLNLDYSVSKNSTKLKKILAGVQYISPSAFLESRKIIMNSSVFSKDTDIAGGYSFLTDLSDKFGTQKIVDFTLLHEFAHITQELNTTEFGITSDIKTHKLIKNLTSLAYDNFHYFEVKNQIKNYEQTIMNGDDTIDNRFQTLDRDFLVQLEIVQREMYADVGGLLHLRNIALHENEFSNKDFSSFIDGLIEARHKEHEAMLNFKSDNIDSFDHFTVEALKSLKDKLSTLHENQVISQSDIHDICQDCLTIGLSRLMLTVAAIHPKLNAQIKNLFYMDRVNFTDVDGKEYSKINLNLTPEDPTVPSKYGKGMVHLKKLAGDEFVNRLTDTVHTTFALKVPAFDIRQVTWKAVFQNPAYLDDLNELKDIFKESNIAQPKLINSNEILTAVSNIRNNSLNKRNGNKNNP